VPEVERDPERRIERPESKGEEPLVARLGDEDPDRTEPLFEQAHPLFECRRLPELVRLHLDGEAERVGRLLGPAAELLLGGDPVPGRVQLDAR
jgi:hypothetical protein